MNKYAGIYKLTGSGIVTREEHIHAHATLLLLQAGILTADHILTRYYFSDASGRVWTVRRSHESETCSPAFSPGQVLVPNISIRFT